MIYVLLWEQAMRMKDTRGTKNVYGIFTIYFFYFLQKEENNMITLIWYFLLDNEYKNFLFCWIKQHNYAFHQQKERRMYIFCGNVQVSAVERAWVLQTKDKALSPSFIFFET